MKPNAAVFLAAILSLILSTTTSSLVWHQRRLLSNIAFRGRAAAAFIPSDNSWVKFDVLPGNYEEVSMKIQKNHHFSLINDTAWASTLPGTRGFVRLGQKGRSYGIATYHQLHCINAIRFSYTVARDGLVTNPETLRAKIGHDNHCFQFIRQSIMCQADDTLIKLPRDGNLSKVGFGVTHRCRNWAQVRNFVLQNSVEWSGKPFALDDDIVVVKGSK